MGLYDDTDRRVHIITCIYKGWPFMGLYDDANMPSSAHHLLWMIDIVMPTWQHADI